MDSLPEPSETVEDEWASMKIRFHKEGLIWNKLDADERILQVGFKPLLKYFWISLELQFLSIYHHDCGNKLFVSPNLNHQISFANWF